MKIRIYPKSLLETIWQQDKLLFTPEAKQPPLCLRCGQPLDRRLVINALSRYADVHICEACGMDEALRDANRCPLPLTEWAAVKNGLSQQRTDFEDPLLTTSCTFEYLFQQGSRPASEIAYSRSDYDGFRSPLFRLLGFLRLPVNGLPIGFGGFRLLFRSLRHSTLCFLFRFGSRLVSVELFPDRRLLIRRLCDTLISVRTCRF